MKTTVKPSGGCRTGLALPGSNGSLQQFSWADLRRDKMGVWTLIDGRWERVRSNRDLKNLGSRLALAPLGSSPEELLALSSVCPSSLTAKDTERTLRFRELLEAGPLAALSNSFANSSSTHEKHLLDLLWGREDSIYSLTARYGDHVTAYYLSVSDDLTDLDIAVLLDMMAQPTRDDVWQEAAKDLLDKLSGVLPESALSGKNGLTTHELYYAMQSSGPGRYTDPSLASDLIDLSLAIFTSHSPEQHSITDAVALARDLLSQHGSARVAMCYLTGIDGDCSLKEALAVYNLGKYGPLSPNEALELVRLVGGDPALLDLMSSELYSTGSLDLSRASFIKDAYDKDPMAAMFQFATSSRAVTALFESRGSSISKNDADALSQAFGFPSLDRAHEDLRVLLESVSLDDFSKMLAYSKLENKSGVPDAELALRLSLAFGSRADEYLKRMTVPSSQRTLLQRGESVAPKIASSVLLARAGKEYIDSAESLDDRRLRRQEVGNAQAYSRDSLNQRLETLRNSIPAISQAEDSIRGKMADIRNLDPDQQDRQELLRLDAELRAYPATLASKETEIKALEALLAGYDQSSTEELSALVKDWVLATPSTTGKNAGLSLHDAAFWLPTDPEVAASLGRWMLDGDRSEKIFARPTSISDMTLITAAWSELASESDPLFGTLAKDSSGVTRSKNDADMSFGRVLERSRAIAASADLGDRFTSELSKTGATATSSQRSLDLLRESFETPTPFPLEKLWTSNDPNSPTLRARFIPRDDVRGTQLGMLTNCCQHPEGAGRTCAESGQTHPSMGFFVVEDAAGKVVSQSWVWADGSGGVCFDNVEGFPGTDRHDSVVDLYEQASKDLLERFDRVTVGAHNAVTFSSAVKTTPLSLSSVGYNGYSDSKSGQLLLASRSSSDSNDLVTLGLADGFIWRQGDSSVTVRPDGLVFDGPQAASIAERMLPSMGQRTWQVSSADGSFSLEISDNPHLTPSIENLPLTLFDPTPVELEKIASFAPDITPEVAASWFKHTGRDIDLVQTAVNNGWDPDSAGLAMRSDNYGRRMLSSPMPSPEVVHGVSLGLSPERAATPSIQGLLSQATALAPDVLPSKITAVLPWASRSSSPAAAAAALSHCESETQYPVVLSLIESGVEPDFVRSLVRQQGFQSFTDGPFDAKYADRIASLSPEEATRVASYMPSRNRELMQTDYFHPEIILTIAHQPQEVVDAVLSCDRSYRNDSRTIDYVLSGGNPEDWGRVAKAVAITDPGENNRASGSFLASVSHSQIDEIDKVLDSVRVERAPGENAPPHYYSPGTLAVFADKQALEQAAEVVRVMNASSEEDYFSRPQNATDFAGIASARVRPQDAEILSQHGITARTLASACGSHNISSRLTGEHVTTLASVIGHPAMPERSADVLLNNPSLVSFASDVFSSTDVSELDLALFERVVSSSVSADQIVFAQAWADPSNREALREVSSRRGNLNQLVASALKKSSALRSLGGFHGSLFKEPAAPMWDV